MKLEEIANVSIGILVHRESVENGKYQYKIFNLNNYEENQEYQAIETDKDFSDKMTQKGDLLFRLVAPNKIILVKEKEEDLLVPSQLCIIRPDKNKINSRFLKWYLESQQGKAQIATEQIGSSIQKISIASLKKIEIPEIIKDLIEVWENEKKVMQDIIETKEMIYENIIEQLVEEEK